MKFSETKITDCYIIEPKVYEDERGYFYESFNQGEFTKNTGIDTPFVQDNQSQSSYGVVRGLHGQQGIHEQAKLVRVLDGKVIDVILDIRKNSPSFGEVFQIELSSENKRQLYIPKGCLHGFSVISDKATFFYKCDQFYHKASEISVNPLDPSLNIKWGIEKDKIILSEKDRQAKLWSEFLKGL